MPEESCHFSTRIDNPNDLLLLLFLYYFKVSILPPTIQLACSINNPVPTFCPYLDFSFFMKWLLMFVPGCIVCYYRKELLWTIFVSPLQFHSLHIHAYAQTSSERFPLQYEITFYLIVYFFMVIICLPLNFSDDAWN